MDNSNNKKKMVGKCFIYRCTIRGQKCPTFGVPKDPDLFQKWVDILRPYSNGKPLLSQHRICHQHFSPDDLEYYFIHMIQGTEVKIEKGRPTLKKGAVPTIFPGQQKVGKKKLGGSDKNVKKKMKKPAREGPRDTIQESTPPPSDLSNTGQLSPVVEELTIDGEEDEVTKESDSLSSECHDTDPIPENQTIPDKGVCFDKDPLTVCINWDALPLPEEIGSLLCDSGARGTSAKQDFNLKLSNKNSLLSCRLKPQAESAQQKNYLSNIAKSSTEKQSRNNSTSNTFRFVLNEWSSGPQTIPLQPHEIDLEPALPNHVESPVASLAKQKLQSTTTLTEDSPLQSQIADSPTSALNSAKPSKLPLRTLDHTETDDTTRNISGQDIEDTLLSFAEFQKKFTRFKLPSSFWATHSDHRCVFFSLLTFAAKGCRAVPRVERIVMYEGNMRPRLFLRDTEVRVPSLSEKDSDSLLAVFNVLCKVQDLRLCLGLNRADGALSFSPDCDVVLGSVKVPRCCACRKEREEEYKKKRHLEYEESRSGCRSHKKRPSGK